MRKRLPIRTRVSLLAAATATVAIALPAAHAAPTSTTEILYAVPTTSQFMNHADDRLRGMSTNPFNVKTAGLVITVGGKEKGNGPFPGDDVLYSFKLYSDAKLAKPAGTAIFTCYYTFVKRATCDSYFELTNGTVLASGQIVFDGTRFTLGVSGGTDHYLGVLGQVSATPAAKNAERLDLRLLDSSK